MLQIFAVLGGAQPEQRKGRALEELIARMAKGESEALEEVYRQTKSAVYGFALSILRRHHEAEDVMQDAFVRIYEAAEQYRPQGKPMAWVLTIVRNLALSRLRSGGRNAFPLEGEGLLGSEGDFADSSADRLLLQGMLSTLTDEERQIVVLHSVAALKHREIAEMLGIPLSTALSKYRRSLSKLRKQLKEEEN